MAKNQKKYISLSMGGVLPRKSQSSNDRPKPAVKPAGGPTQGTVKIRKNPVKKPVKKDKKRSLRLFSLTSLRNNFILLALGAFIAVLYLIRLKSLPPIQHAGNIYNSGEDIRSIIYLPAKISLLALSKLHINFSIDARLLSILITLFSIFCFYRLTSEWISRRIAVISTLVYACSSWVLAQTRAESLSSMMLALIPVLLYAGSLLVNSKSNLAKVILIIILLQFIFIPGAVWFFLVAGIICLVYFRKSLDFRSILAPVIAVLLIAAADAALVFHFSLVKLSELYKLAGLSSGHLPALEDIKYNLLHLPGQLFLNGINDSSVWLYPTPIIDWVSAVLLFTGLVYLTVSKLHPARKKIIFSFIILSLILIVVNGPAFISVLLPVLYLAIAAGIAYLLQQWLAIFPSNPLARYLGLVIICLVVFLICGYNLERYFIGWPKTDGYHQVFQN